MSNGTVGDLHSLPDWGKAGLTWTVQSSDGGTISSAGVFKATKPGGYLVAVSMEVADHDDPATDWTRVTVTEGETTTIETTAGNAFAGTYGGTWHMPLGDRQLDVPWGFTVDDEGNVKGGLDYSFEYAGVPGHIVLTFTGVVSDDGHLTASGVGTTTHTPEDGPQSVSGPASLNGQILDATFVGVAGGTQAEPTR